MLNLITLVALGILFGSQYYAIKLALGDISPLWLSTLRLACAASFMLLCVFATTGWQHLRLTHYLFCLGVAILGEVVAPLGIAYASHDLPSGVVGVGIACAPFITLLLSVASDRKNSVSYHNICSLSLGFAGVCLLFWPSFSAVSSVGFSMITLIIAAVALGVLNWLVRYITDIPLTCAAAIACCWGLLLLAPPTLMLEEMVSFDTLPNTTITAIVFLGIGVNALGTLGAIWLIKRTSPVFTSYTGFIIPMTSLGIGYLHGEALSAYEILAIICIFSGLFFLNDTSNKNS